MILASKEQEVFFMSEVQKEETKHMNPKKALCSMLLCFIILCIIAGVGTIVKFGDRETDWENLLQLTGSDYIYLVCIVLAFWVLLCIYWLYVTVYVATKAGEVGANMWLFGALTLVTNLFGAVCLWAYIRLHQICPGCGKLQSRKANYCAACGTAMYQKCPDCGARVSVKDQYCTGCGRKMHEEK